MTDRERSTFEQCIIASHLLSEEQVDETLASLRQSESEATESCVPPSDKELGQRLVELGLLNTWQVKQLRNGRTKFSLGRYRIIDSLGQGGMGHVFKAVDTRLGRVVAVKVLPRYKATPEAVYSFAREVQIAGRLQHPRLVTAFDAGHDGNVHFLVTEFVPGLDLRKWVRRDGPLSMTAAAAIICQVAEGLQYAHDQGMVHRDVKPGNVLVTPRGEAKLSDLGLAEPLVPDTNDDPRQGKIVGTADYLSPDQVLNPSHPSPVWDIYSLGCTLYYAVTGKVPFPGGSTADKARAHCDLRPLDPRRLNSTLTDEFVDLLADMMAKDPAQRTTSASEVIRRLTPFVTGQPPMPAPASEARPQNVKPASPPAATPANSVIALPRDVKGAMSPATAAARLPVQPPSAMGWDTADTQTDEYAIASGQVNNNSLRDPIDSFDLAFLDEEVVPSIDVPTRPPSVRNGSVWPRRMLIAAAVVVGILVIRWLVQAVHAMWTSWQ